MNIETSGPIAVQARIAAIQGMFAQSTLATGTSRATGSTSRSTGDFAATLAKLTAKPADGVTRPGSAAVTGDQVVADARRYLGVPYVWGGTDPAKGLDCSGLVQRVYKDLGIDLPRVSQDQARAGTKVPSLAQAKPGDLLVFGTGADHIGIYIGGHKMIVAPKAGDVVKVQDVYRTPSTIRRILPESSAHLSQALTSATPASSTSSSPTSSAASSRAMAAAPAAYRTLFEQAGRRHGVSPDLLAAVAQTESGFNPRAVSGAGARGLMQLMPSTARGLGVNPADPTAAVDGAARLLSQHLHTFGSTSLALAAYNAGPGAVSRYHGVPPYAETRSYVAKVLAAAGRSA